MKKNNKITIVEDFLLKVDASTKSVEWLDARITEVTKQIDDLEEKETRLFKTFPNKRKALVKELRNLYSRADIERKTLDSLESQIIKFIQDFKNEKEIEKKKIKRKKT